MDSSDFVPNAFSSLASPIQSGKSKIQSSRSHSNLRSDDISLSSTSSLPLTSRSTQSLASLTLPRIKRVSSQDFIRSKPVTRRGLYDCFGASQESDDIDEIFSRRQLRTPYDVLRKINNHEKVDLNSEIAEGAKKKKKYRIRRDEDQSSLHSRGSSRHSNRSKTPLLVVHADHKLPDTSKVFFFSENDKQVKLEAIERRRKERIEMRKRVREERQRREAQALAEDDHEISAEVIADEIGPVQHKYFGEKARDSFYKLFHQSSRDLAVYANDSDIPSERKTPRSLLLRGQEKRKLLPLKLTQRKEANPKGVFLRHRGLGDERMLPLIAVLPDLPAVEYIDFCDNRLTDTSLSELARMLNGLRSLTHLDLSFNKIDDCSGMILDYLRSSTCRLKTFLMNGADVDDHECDNIMHAVAVNATVRHLGLSNNLIGESELRNVTNPDLITGGEALGRMLLSNCTLKSLDVSWNAIRLSSAESLANSLSSNKTLTKLNLAYNTFGDMGTQVLGKALKKNVTLRYLDVSYNNIVPRSAMVLANALCHNDFLTFLNIDGNVLGSIGTATLVAAMQRSKVDNRVLRISFNNCDCKKIEKDEFNPANPNGTWTVDLAEPYGHMLAEESIFLANTKAGCKILRYEVDGKVIQFDRKVEGGEGKFVLADYKKNCADTAKEILQSNTKGAVKPLADLLKQFRFHIKVNKCPRILQMVEDNWKLKAGSRRSEDLHEVILFEVFYAIFIINDVDCSGAMEVDEFLVVLADLGMPDFNVEVLKRLMAEHDKDDSGTIDANEFSMIMVTSFCQTEAPRGYLVEKSSQRPYAIPPRGKLTLQMAYECDLPTSFDCGNVDGIESVIEAIQVAKTQTQKDLIFEHAVTSPYFFLNADQAQSLFDEIQVGGRKTIDVMMEILPQMVNPEQSNVFIDSNLDDFGKLQLRVKIGQLYNCYVGLPTGHYLLDLSQIFHVRGGKRLSGYSNAEAKVAKTLGANTSQKGKLSSFRNEKYNGENVSLGGAWFTACPEAGTIQCDFVSTSRPKQGTKPLSDHRFVSLKRRLALDEILLEKRRLDETIEEITQLELAAAEAKAAAASHFSAQKAKAGGGSAMATPAVRVELDLEAPGVSGLHLRTLRQQLDIVVPPPLTMRLVKDHYLEYMSSCHHYLDIYPQERQRDMSRASWVEGGRPPTPQILSTGAKPSITKMHPLFPVVYAKLVELQVLMPHTYLSVEQLKELLIYFPKMGYLRVQLLQSVFSHITDVENVASIVHDIFDDDERVETFHRVGILNIYDPLSPDYTYKLDLRRWDNREMAKILISLSISEPGTNWMDETYRWSKYDDHVPGWQLPSTWTLDDDDPDAVGEAGPRTMGWLIVTYTSTGPGCMPVMKLRRKLRRRVLAGMKRIT